MSQAACRARRRGIRIVNWVLSSINPAALGGLGLRFNRNGPADPEVQITQTSGPDYRNLANYPNGFTATSNDRQGEDQRWLFKADTQYNLRRRFPILFKTGLHINQWVNNSDRPLNNFLYTRRGADNTANSADENLALWAEKSYRMNSISAATTTGCRTSIAGRSTRIPGAPGILERADRRAVAAVSAAECPRCKRAGRRAVQPDDRQVRHSLRWPRACVSSTRADWRKASRTSAIARRGGVSPAALRAWWTRRAWPTSRHVGGGRSAAKQDYDTWLRFTCTPRIGSAMRSC